jgi:vanillate O-demethylase monooxygenase subunit
MSFILNASYAAAWASELSDGLFERRRLGQPVLMFRDEDGKITALNNRCPDRFAPSSADRRRGSVVECGYHGLGFDLFAADAPTNVTDLPTMLARQGGPPTPAHYA